MHGLSRLKQQTNSLSIENSYLKKAHLNIREDCEIGLSGQIVSKDADMTTRRKILGHSITENLFVPKSPKFGFWIQFPCL